MSLSASLSGFDPTCTTLRQDISPSSSIFQVVRLVQFWEGIEKGSVCVSSWPEDWGRKMSWEWTGYWQLLGIIWWSSVWLCLEDSQGISPSLWPRPVSEKRTWTTQEQVSVFKHKVNRTGSDLTLTQEMEKLSKWEVNNAYFVRGDLGPMLHTQNN